jgi:hypothetical protein
MAGKRKVLTKKEEKLLFPEGRNPHPYVTMVTVEEQTAARVALQESRDARDKAEATRAEIVAATGNDNVAVALADLSLLNDMEQPQAGIKVESILLTLWLNT